MGLHECYSNTQASRLERVAEGVFELSQKLKQESVKPFRFMRGKVRQSERPYTLRLLDERARGTSMPGLPDFFEKRTVKVPTPSLGWCLPNNFEVTIDGLVVKFRVELLKNGKQGRWAISSLHAEPSKKSEGVENINLPLQTFLRDAIELSTLRCITYPPGYEGASVVSPAWQIKSDKGESFVEVQGWADKTPAPLLRDFTQVGSGRKRDSEERLSIVAKAYEEASFGEIRERVKVALQKSEGVVGDETVKRLIQKVIKQGRVAPRERGEK